VEEMKAMHKLNNMFNFSQELVATAEANNELPTWHHSLAGLTRHLVVN
jgi:hypothetical protein